MPLNTSTLLDAVEFIEAVDAFRARVPMQAMAARAMAEAQRQRAFWVSGVTQADVINDVWESIERAVRDGVSLDEFKRETGPTLIQEWAGSVANPGARLETIYRTNVQNAYGAGAHAQRTDPTVRRQRPYWQFRAITDSRICPICAPLDGVVLPADDPFWLTHTPPLHYQDRCQLVALDEDEAIEEGYRPGTPPPKSKADDGFGMPPTTTDWTPDVSKYPAPIQAILTERLKKAA